MVSASRLDPLRRPTAASNDSDHAPSAEATPPIALGHLLRLARVAGYGLLVVSFVDFLYVLIPADFMDPVWEYQFAGDLIKLVPVPLLALVLVFGGDAIDRQEVEWPILKVLSWLTLLFSVTLFLLVPLTAANTLRIHRFNNEQISTQANQQRQQIEATRTQLEQATPQQLQSLVPTPNEQGQLPNAPVSPEDARAQILNNLNQAKDRAADQADQARANVKQNLTKNSLKLIAESILGSLMFLYAWLISRWARRGKGILKTAAVDQPINPATAFGRRMGHLLGRKPKRMKHRVR
ncbi:HpsJ family protein [Leptolyngbya sp. CCNP1308]|uniref:HpsJ-like protein, cyanoexosortase A-associated n=1 Tax=Leptolyngbya sp. CCNP1308 TaxID=3110255 RepID=UPI002B2036C1|nr:HpsJ family protein [Leptolyngbya sp. CCNP1308]MEA5452419.1 HpsJ family protein [Leptolyngbya sp. CCNP1308]